MISKSSVVIGWGFLPLALSNKNTRKCGTHQIKRGSIETQWLFRLCHDCSCQTQLVQMDFRDLDVGCVSKTSGRQVLFS